MLSAPLLRRLAPLLAFASALCLLVLLCHGAGYSGLPPTEKRYVAAKASISSLRQDERKNNQREPWEKLAAEFQSIYNTDPAWPNRPAALFRAAESLEELTRRSCSRSDARKAINCYESLALRHASSRLADDALFRAANMRATWLKDEKGALALLARLKKQYPDGDMIAGANALEKALKASANGQTASAALKKAGEVREAREDLPADISSKPGITFTGDLPLRYRAAKSRMEVLKKDNVRRCWRQSWEDLRNEFLKINKSAKNRLAPQALFQAAQSQAELSKCSRLAVDRKKAIELFLQVAKEFPAHALADDSLLEAARLQKLTPASSGALALINRLIKEYPSGDMIAEAKKLKSLWEGNSAFPKVNLQTARQISKSSEPPELQVISWDSPNKNNVQIVMEMSSPARFATRLVEGKKGQPAKLFMDFENASVVNDIRKGVAVQGSLLKAVKVHTQKKSTSLQFDFREVGKFEARSEQNPCRIILSVATAKPALPKQAPDREVVASTGKKTATPRKGVQDPARNVRQVSNMASQLGLTVHRVFIDAGHGGKDPGTSHNKILERAVTLDIALALGRLLQANGLQVVYSRSKDNTVALSERTRLANSAGTDLFVSIHVNAHENPQINGFETYYLDLATTPQAARVATLENAGSDRRLGDMQKMLADVMLNARADESRRLASDIQRLSIFRLKKRNFQTRNNGVKSAPFHVLCGAKMPAVLVEIGYCSNPAEARNLASPAYRHAIAEGLAEGILAYRDRLLRNRTAGNSLTEADAGAM